MVAVLGLLGLGLSAAILVYRCENSFFEDVHAFMRLLHRIEPAPRLDSFEIADPYDCPGVYRKAQLHMHTSNSMDVRGKVPVPETILRYKQAGYSFVVVTDHDRVTDVTDLSRDDFVVVPGEERTIPFPVWPAGRHLLKIGIGAGELTAPAHPSWVGNFGTGRWSLADLMRLENYQLLEIFNGKSNSLMDFWLWHKVLQKRGHQNPVWGIAVDDSDNAEPLDAAWVMIKTASVSRESLLAALRAGNFYATMGVSADFRVENGVIKVETKPGALIRFIDGRCEVVAASRGQHGEYKPLGDEGFVRVEVIDPEGRAAWSQPFFLVPGR